ncbi:hypothetical protein AAG906_012405 [Vitis piasezkii]
MPRAPREESSIPLIFQQRDNVIKITICQVQCARLGPQERTKATRAATWAPHRPYNRSHGAGVPPHPERPIGRNLPNEPPIGSIRKRLDDMLSTPFCSHIIHYEPPRGFLVPKFSTYDGTNDPFDHIMHYRQLMTLDIGNDALLCKVFPASLQGQALSWFHRLPPNSVDNFRDLSEAFVGQYLCSARHKQNISTLQNIKMRDNESLREFVKRFGQAVLQIEACSMDAVLQIFKRSICPGTPFFESLAKKPPTTMDDLFRRANKYSMLEDDIRAPLETHRNGPIHEKPQQEVCLPQRPWSYNRDMPYLRSDTGGRDASQHHNSGPPKAPAAPKAVINYINGGPSDEEYDSRRKRQKLLRAASIRERINSIRRSRGSRKPRTNLIRIQRVINHILRRHHTPVKRSELSPFNVILGRTWLHYMKAIPSTYHQMVSFLTNEGQTDLYGSQLAARQCYQIARAGTSQEDVSPPEPSHAHDQ